MSGERSTFANAGLWVIESDVRFLGGAMERLKRKIEIQRRQLDDLILQMSVAAKSHREEESAQIRKAMEFVNHANHNSLFMAEIALG